VPGSFVPVEGSVAAVACGAGTYQPGFGAAECIAASKGHFVPGEAATEQMRCPIELYQPEEGQAFCTTRLPDDPTRLFLRDIVASPWFWVLLASFMGAIIAVGVRSSGERHQRSWDSSPWRR
jgi:hypothetical protein